MEDFMRANYCDINSQCESKCCLFGECIEYSECF